MQLCLWRHVSPMNSTARRETHCAALQTCAMIAISALCILSLSKLASSLPSCNNLPVTHPLRPLFHVPHPHTSPPISIPRLVPSYPEAMPALFAAARTHNRKDCTFRRKRGPCSLAHSPCPHTRLACHVCVTKRTD